VSARGRLALGLALVALPAAAGAQRGATPRAFELERRGDYPGAAAIYRAVLASRPADLAALLGLERVLLPLNQSAAIIPQVRAALSADPRSAGAYGVALRAWAAADQPDSMRVTAERWAAAAPGDETPYREWGAAALSRRDRPGAIAAFSLGRERLGRPDALAAELAQLAAADGDYVASAREWVPAIRRLPGYLPTAVAALSQAPEPLRDEVLHTLSDEREFLARRVETELLVRWGRPGDAVEQLEKSLPEDKTTALAGLHGLVDQLRAARAPDALRAKGRTLELIADRTSDATAARARLEAAQAYSAAGDGEAAQRLLAELGESRPEAGDLPPGAASTLVTVLADEGKLDDASRRLEELAPGLRPDERAELRRTLVRGYVKAGEVDRARQLLGTDSTADGLALQGWLQLYQGDVAGALAAFRLAGPFAGDRADATRRTVLLALLQPIEADSVPELGHALLTLARGDTGRAAGELERVGAGLPPAKGGAEATLLAARLAAAGGDTTTAERLFRVAAVPEAPATAPAAELALGELLLARQRIPDGIAQLEHLILTYPQSVLVPQARRLLDQARGAVPRT
jgi:thioredoxin-like negative regulator of GroEL